MLLLFGSVPNCERIMPGTATENFPLLNITMPVWNRAEDTLCSIASVARNTGTPYMLTVVDNGSDEALRKELLDLHRLHCIHHLYFLDRNYGVSCACNLGWKLHPAPLYMKLDNDMEVLSATWMQDICRMWGKARYSSIIGPVWDCTEEEGRVVTEHGTYWTLPRSFSGAALLVSAKTVQRMGYLCEDYGLYGEKDADYCLRCHYAGIRKYTFACESLIRHRGVDDAEYLSHNIDKRAAHAASVRPGVGTGLFALKVFMYQHGLGSLDVPLKYEVAAVHGHSVQLRENPHYGPFFAALQACTGLMADSNLDTPHKIQAIQTIFESSGVHLSQKK